MWSFLSRNDAVTMMLESEKKERWNEKERVIRNKMRKDARDIG